MTRTITITADDFGLSRGITDLILETVDKGPVRRVSIVANGEAVSYALEEYKKRKKKIELVVHINLTEGKALSIPSDIPHLAMPNGKFKHSVISLWLSYIFANKRTRAALRAEVQNEIRTQIQAIQKSVVTERVAVNGHQHTHLIPFVADVLTAMPEVASLRSVNEPAYLSGACSAPRLLSRSVIRHLSNRATVINKTGNEWFIGFNYMGCMTIDRIKRGLRNIPDGRVEILFHPGSAYADELLDWSASCSDLDWYHSSRRMDEKNELLNLHFNEALKEPYEGVASFGRIVKFIISGSLSAVITLSLLYALTEYAKLWYLLSVVIALSVSTVTSFILQKFWTFRNSSATHLRSQFGAFILLNIINVVLNTTGLYFVVELLHVWYLVAEILVAGIIAVWSFFVMRFFIFKPRIVS